jgi:ATP-dependent protease ClpP protease subunit
MRPLINLLTRNKAASRPLAMERNGNDVTIECVGTLISTDEDALWWGGVSAQAFARELRGLTEADTLHVRLNSPGGDVFAGVAMAQAIRECRANVIVHIDGVAASAASTVAIAAPRSIIAPGGMVMIHNAWTIAVGNEVDMRRTADLLGKVDGEIAAAYQTKAGGDLDDWRAAMAAETWYTGAEAVAAGLVDEVAGAAPANAAAKALFDLSAFEHAPQPAGQDAASETTETTVRLTLDASALREAVNDALAALRADAAAEADAAEIARRRRVAAAIARRKAA